MKTGESVDDSEGLPPDVVVLGAGVAGLAAAGELTRGGARVTLIEARGRVGGRVYTLHRDDWSLPVELGAEFIDVPGPAWDALRSAGGAAYRSVDGVWSVGEGNANPLDLEGVAERTLGKLDPQPAADEPFRQWLDRQSNIDEADRAWVLRYVEGFHAADLDRVGVHWLAQASEGNAGGGGEVRFHPLTGFDQVAAALRSELGAHCELLLETIATAVDWEPGSVRVSCRSHSEGRNAVIQARRALITLPLGVLQAAPLEPGAVRFSPAIEPKLRAVRSLAMGSVLKVVLRFREALWERHLTFHDRQDGVPTERKLFVTEAVVPTWWTTSPVLSPVLTGWAGGGATSRVRGAGAPPQVALTSLAGILGISVDDVEASLLDHHFHDWDADPFSRGAYSYVPAGALQAQEELRRPIENTLFFAGEATAPNGANGTVDGAIETGRRAAQEILDVMRS